LLGVLYNSSKQSKNKHDRYDTLDDLTRMFMTSSEIGMMNMCCRHERVIRFPTTLLQAARLSNLSKTRSGERAAAVNRAASSKL
jgi:hypothetical protein